MDTNNSVVITRLGKGVCAHEGRYKGDSDREI